MADTRISDLTAIDALAAGDSFAVADASTAASRKVSGTQLSTFVNSNITLQSTMTVNSQEIVSVGATDIVLHSDNDLNVILGDAAGADDFNIKDSANAIVASINSDGALTAVSYGGIAEANLLDKSAAETVSGAYTFSTNIQFGNATGINDDSANEQLLFQKTASAVNYVTITNAATAGSPVFAAAGSDANVDLTLDGQGSGVVKTTSSNLDITGNIIVSGTVDGRDIATDGSKLDGIEALADVTDEANVVAALDGATLTGVTVANNDKVLIQDTSDTNNIKTVTTQAIADLRTIEVSEDTTPQLGGQLDVNGQALGDGTLELLTFTETALAVNQVNVTNAATTTGPIVSSAGDDVNIDLNLLAKGAGKVTVQDGADATKQVSVNLTGATTGTETTLAVSQTANRTITLPDATTTLIGADSTATLTNKTFDANGAGNSISNVDLSADVIGNLPVTNLNSGTSASASTFWRGDGTWASPAGSGDVVGPASATDNAVVRFDTTTGKLVQDSGVIISDTQDITAYDATNDGNPVLAYGASATERLTITPTYSTGTQTLEYVDFNTDTASATADFGEYRFNVDGTLVTTIDDGGVEIKASGSLSFGAVDILTDSAGTTTLSNIDAIDATTESTIEAAIDTLANLTSATSLTDVGALNAGSITTGFGAIDNGTSNITTGGILKVDVDGTGINAAGSITYGTGNDVGIYWDGDENYIHQTTALTNSITYNTLKHDTSGVPANGIGVGLQFEQETAADNYEKIAAIAARVTDTTATAEDAAVDINLMIAGAAHTTTATFDLNGLNLASGDGYSIAGTSVLNATTLGSGVTASSLTSLGTLTALQVDNLNVNGNTISSTSGAVNITPLAGQAIVLDGTINVDAGVVTGATSITSTSFVGALTGNADTVTTNANLTGEVTSTGNAAVLNVTAISNQTLVTAASGDHIVIRDATDGALKKVDALDFLSGSGIANVVEDTTPQLGGQLDVNGNAIGDGTLELITFTEDASAVNQVNIENEATGSGPIISAAGDDANIDLNLNGKATGNVIVRDGTDVTKKMSFELGSATTATTLTLTSSQTASRTVTLPDATCTLVGKDTTDTFTNKTFNANGTGNSLSNVDVADLAVGTDGELITWDSSGNPTTVAVGTAGHVLTSNGTGAAPTFQASSGWVQLATASASTSATIELTGMTGYSLYVVLLEDIVPATASTALCLKTSSDGGSNYDGGASNYAYVYTKAVIGSITATGSGGQTKAFLGYAELGNGTGEGLSGLIYFFDPGASTYTRMRSITNYYANGGANTINECAATRLSAGVVNAVQFLMSSGNITSGTFTLYAIV